MGLPKLGCALTGIGSSREVDSDVSDKRYARIIAGEETADTNGLVPLDGEEELAVKVSDCDISNIS